MHTEKQVLRKSGVDAVLKMCHDNPVVVILVVTKPIRRFYWKGKYLLILNLTFIQEQTFT